MAMVNNPVIATGYPVPNRDDMLHQHGLEISLGLMVALSRADWATTFGNVLLLKGTISALVAVSQDGNAILWHFVVKQGTWPRAMRPCILHRRVQQRQDVRA